MPTIPETMFAIHIDPEHKTLSWQPHPTPALEPGHVMVKVSATAVNRADLMQRQGLYPPPPGASDIMGLECAGTVGAVGPGCQTSVKVGQRVCALLAGGGYAQYVAVPEHQLLPIPEHLSDAQAAALPEVLITAYLNLFIEAPTQAGDWALIHAAASGVGTAALQLCRAKGVKSIAVASGHKLDALRELGAQVLVDRHSEDFVEVVKQATQRRGVATILDPVGGGEQLDRNIKSLAQGGSLVIIGLMGGARAQEVDLGRILVKRLKVVGSVLRSRSLEEKAQLVAQVLAHAWPLVERGELQPVIEVIMSVEQAEQAHQLLATNKTTGKIVLTVPT